MLRISALVPVRDHDRLLGRTLETLRPCDEVVVVDCGSLDGSLRIALEYGARVIAVPEAGMQDSCSADWVLCLTPGETLSEELEASLFDWKASDPGTAVAFAIRLRTEIANGWQSDGAEVRLVRRKSVDWTNGVPRSSGEAPILSGDLLRIR